jgi:hypothetical protein
VLELAEVITELRAELQKAIDAAARERLRFELGPVDLEATIGLEKGTGGGAKVKFWVLELGGDVKASRTSTHRIKLTLEPKLAGSDTKPWVSGDDTGNER